MDRIKGFWKWFEYTSYPFGLVALAVVMVLSLRAVSATVTCTVFEYKCEYAISAKDAIAESMENLLTANKGTDIVARPRK